MLKDDLMSAITHAKALLREELYPMMAEIKEFYCLFTSSKKTKYHWENVLGNLTIDSWKIRQFNSMNHHSFWRTIYPAVFHEELRANLGSKVGDNHDYL